jgi:hypothetical protein
MTGQLEIDVKTERPRGEEGGEEEEEDEFGEGLSDASYLQTPWKPPSRAIGQSQGRSGVWKGGAASFVHTTIRDFAELGSGVYLYFKLLLIVSALFVFLALLYLPLLLLNFQGNEGHALLPSQKDQTGLAVLTLANQGFNVDTLESPTECLALNGTVDCSG